MNTRTRFQTMRRIDQVLFLIGAVLIGAYFLLLTSASLKSYFTPDDTMNLYVSWVLPLRKLVQANLLFFQTSPFHRPMGAAWYRSIFRFAGFNPLPFHIASLAILAANMFLTYSVSRRLGDSREIAAIATLIGCYHPRFAALYFDTGYIYDVLCYLFYFSAFLVYLRVRQHQGQLRVRALAACSVLYVCALNSKEMAITLPIFVAIYELLYDPPSCWSWVELRRWVVRQGRGAIVTGVLALAFAIGRATGPESLLAYSAYRPILTWDRFMETSRNFLDDIFCQDKWFSSNAVLLLWAVLLLVAWLAKSRPLKFSWLFLMLSVAPVAFIYPRGAAQYYIPWFGWTLYGATAVAGLAGWLARKIPGGAGFWPTRVRAAGLLAGLALLLFPYYRAVGWSRVPSVTLEAPIVRSISEQLRGLHPRVRSGAHFLFIDDPYKREWENVMFIVRLTYHDDSLIVDRVKKMSQPPSEQQLATYDYVIDYKGGRFMELSRPWRRATTPMITINPDGAEVYHSDWTPVTRDNPAKPGEVVLSRATDLGGTQPEVPPGKAFPGSPLLPVRSQVEVRVEGKPTEVVLQIGWPEMVNTYRVDFRVPNDTPKGMAKVEVTAGGATGPAVLIPVGAR